MGAIIDSTSLRDREGLSNNGQFGVEVADNHYIFGVQDEKEVIYLRYELVIGNDGVRRKFVGKSKSYGVLEEHQRQVRIVTFENHPSDLWTERF